MSNSISQFKVSLRKPGCEAFNELIYAFRSYASEISNATNPIVFEPMVMSILLGQQKKILALEKKLNINQHASSINEPEQAREK